jgi:hypothetical protein
MSTEGAGFLESSALGEGIAFARGNSIGIPFLGANALRSLGAYPKRTGFGGIQSFNEGTAFDGGVGRDFVP